MRLMQFHKLRAGLQDNAYPGSGRDVATMEANLRDLLMASGLFDEVEVEHTDDPDQLIIGLCRFNADWSEEEIARAVEALWQNRVRYPFWEAHTLVVEPEYVEFEAATRNSENGHYITVHMVAEKGRIPEQREAPE